MKLLCALLVVCAVACAPASDGDTDAGCSATFTGNFAAVASGDATCAKVEPGDDGSTTLHLGARPGALGADLDVTIDLGSSPAAGSYSSEDPGAWSAIAVASNNCEYSAGSDSVPTGSYALDLTSVDAGTAHGTLRVVQYVQAPPAVDCGSGDIETVEFEF